MYQSCPALGGVMSLRHMTSLRGCAGGAKVKPQSILMPECLK